MKLNRDEIQKLKSWLFSVHNVAEVRAILTKIFTDTQLWTEVKTEMRWNLDFHSLERTNYMDVQLQSFLREDQAVLRLRNFFFLYLEEDLGIIESYPLPKQAHYFRDMRGVPCPNNLIRTRGELKKIPSQVNLMIWLDKGQPFENVPMGLRTEGYRILQQKSLENFGLLEIENL